MLGWYYVEEKLKLKNQVSHGSFYYGLVVHSTNNLGDDIQSLAAIQFLPYVNFLMNRDYISRYKPPKYTKVIFNGWYMEKPENWPPDLNVIPLFISFHISPNNVEKFLNSVSISYLKRHSPIGCRDLFTKSLLESYGIDAYFSGCLTLTLGYRFDYLKKEGNYYLIVDIDPIAFDALPKEVKENSLRVTQQNPTGSFYRKILLRLASSKIKQLVPSSVRKFISSRLLYTVPFVSKDEWYIKRLKVALERLKQIAAAKVVITSRLHIALPALAFNKPVVFINKNLSDPRFTGLLDFLNAYDLETFINNAKEIDWDNIENPNREKLEVMKQLKDVKPSSMIVIIYKVSGYVTNGDS